MSGFSYPQPTFASSIYNPRFYLTLDANGNLTYDYAKTIFLDRNDYRLAYLSGVLVGIGAPGTALVLNSSSSITGGLVDFTASGALKGATIKATTGFQLNGVALDFSNLSYLSGITAGTAANSKALILSSTGTISGIISLSAATINATTIQQTGTTFNLANMYSTGTTSITLSGTLSAGTVSCSPLQQGGTSYTLSSMLTSSTTSISMTTITGTTVNASTTLQIGGTAITATAVTLNYCDITTLGTAQASKVITCNSLRDIININSLTASSLTGTIQTASQPNITSVGTLGSLTVSASVSCTKMNNTQSIITNGGANYLSGTSRVDPYNLVIVSPADTAGTASGIAFYNDGSGGVGFTASSFTPSCSIVAQRVAGSYAISDLVFYTRSADADISALNERMRISQAGNISLGGVGGAQNVNLLTNGSCGFRIGAAESSKNCFTMQYTYAGAASSNNALSFDCYGTRYQV